MPSDPTADPPNPANNKKPESANHSEPPPQSTPEVEYDDFGLPIRKARPRTPLPRGADLADVEGFKDAVGKAASKEPGVLPETDAVKGEKGEKEEAESTKEEVEPGPTVNGHAEKSPEEAKVEKEEDEKEEDEKEEDEKEEDEKEKHKDGKADPSPSPSPSDAPEPTKVHKRIKSSVAHGAVSEFSHQQLAPQTHQDQEKTEDGEGEWQAMPAYARFDMYDDDNRLIAKEAAEELEDMSGYGNLGGAAKGYTRVIMDDDVESVTSMDDNTAYLFKETGTALHDEDEAARDPLAQMQATKNLLTEGQRVAYVGLVRLGLVDMKTKFAKLERNKNTKKILDTMQEANQMWTQKMMVRLYSHMDISESEQVMIEQLSEHGVVPADLTPALMKNARVKNPVVEGMDEEGESAKEVAPGRRSVSSQRPDPNPEKSKSASSLDLKGPESPAPPPYKDHEGDDLPEAQIPSQLPNTEKLDIDLRWTILCDLFLVLIADSIYDSRSRQLLELVGKYLSVDWLEICRFEKRVTEALEMQEEATKENWNEDEHMETRRKKALKKRIAFMGLATVGGTLVIGLSAGLLAPVIGAGLAAGFTTIGVAGTGGFLAGAGGAAVITTTAALSGGTIAVRAANNRTGAVKTFEYRPLHNNKRANLIVTLAGWMNGKLDDVRLPYSTVDPVMGDIYSVLWEPEVLRSMGDTINILATEALTQGLQQVLGSTILVALMAALQLPVVLTKLAYLIDNPWTVSQTRGDMAGLILADSLIDRNLGTRPITLVGFSLGARVIFSCLKELARRGAVGLVQNVYMFGTPIVAKKDEYIKARSVVPGRFVNGYATNDWILGYLFRATSGGVMKVAGLAPVEVAGIENYDVTDLVPGHMAYRAAMPRLLREVGWIVDSDEFAEIEDPDPENHEKRQRELINEIEEARKELEKKPEKKGFAFWRKKKTKKQEWEVYDEKSQAVGKDGEKVEGEGVNGNPDVLFDVEAIRREVENLSYADRGEPIDIEIKEIKSTLPPMKIDLTQTSPNPYGGLRETKSYNDSLPASAGLGGSTGKLSTYGTNGDKEKSFEEYDEFDDGGGMTMTFDSSFKEPPTSSSVSFGKSTSPIPSPYKSPIPPSTSTKDIEPSWNDTPTWKDETSPARPPLKSASTMPVGGSKSSGHADVGMGYNAWADEFDEFGHAKEMKMTFE